MQLRLQSVDRAHTWTVTETCSNVLAVEARLIDARNGPTEASAVVKSVADPQLLKKPANEDKTRHRHLFLFERRQVSDDQVDQ